MDIPVSFSWQGKEYVGYFSEPHGDRTAPQCSKGFDRNSLADFQKNILAIANFFLKKRLVSIGACLA
jgi:hypothetical protein